MFRKKLSQELEANQEFVESKLIKTLVTFIVKHKYLNIRKSISTLNSYHSNFTKTFRISTSQHPDRGDPQPLLTVVHC